MSKIIKISSNEKFIGKTTAALLIADDLATGGYKTLVIIPEYNKKNKVLDILLGNNYFEDIKSKENSLKELFLLKDTNHITDERLLKYSLKVKENLDLIVSVEKNSDEKCIELIKNTLNYDFVVFTQNDDCFEKVLEKNNTKIDMSVQMQTQEIIAEKLEYEELEFNVKTNLLILGKYKHYNHFSLKKFERWIPNLKILKISQEEDVNRSYFKNKLLHLNLSVDKEIDQIVKWIIKAVSTIE